MTDHPKPLEIEILIKTAMDGLIDDPERLPFWHRYKKLEYYFTVSFSELNKFSLIDESRELLDSLLCDAFRAGMKIENNRKTL